MAFNTFDTWHNMPFNTIKQELHLRFPELNDERKTALIIQLLENQ